MLNNFKDRNNRTKQSVHEEAQIVRKIVVPVILIVLALIFLIGIALFIYINSSLKAVNKKDDAIVDVEIPLGSSTTQIAQTLKAHDVIKNERIFKLYTKFKNKSDFQAGNYELKKSMDIDEVIDELQKGKIMNEPVHKVTIPEGKTITQIAMIFEKQLDINSEKFIAKADDKDFLSRLEEQFPKLITKEILKEGIKHPLEGYLYASTYEFFEESPDIEHIITTMVEQTAQNIESLELDKEIGFSVHEILTLASVIERESKFPEDRPKVAQVFLNRINEGMKLQSDITAAYALDEHKVVMTYDDIAVNSPYNTYLVDALPIGPINSPSKESIEAVIEPEGEAFTQVYFYARPNGETFYASTLEEHNKIKKKYEHEWHELNEDK